MSGQTLNTFGFMKSIKKGRSTLICWYPGYQHGFRNSRHRAVFTTTARRYLVTVWGIGRSGRGLHVRRNLWKWVTWWTFGRFKAQDRLLIMSLSTSVKRHRRFMFEGYVRFKPLAASVVPGPVVTVRGPVRSACFAATCRKARACMMHLENCGFPTNIGPKI